MLAAGIGAGLYLGWGYLSEYEHLRAPWTGVMLVASGLAFVSAGVTGRGWRAVLASVFMAGLGALVLTDPWSSEPLPQGGPESCDPGCISPEGFITMAALVAAALTIAGIALRRMVRSLRPKLTA